MVQPAGGKIDGVVRPQPAACDIGIDAIARVDDGVRVVRCGARLADDPVVARPGVDVIGTITNLDRVIACTGINRNSANAGIHIIR